MHVVERCFIWVSVQIGLGREICEEGIDVRDFV